MYFWECVKLVLSCFLKGNFCSSVFVNVFGYLYWVLRLVFISFRRFVILFMNEFLRVFSVYNFWGIIVVIFC